MSGKPRSLFFDEWQACLRAHYVHVIRTNDAVNERTLRHVLLQSGLSEDALLQLHVEALASSPTVPDAEATFEEPVPEPDGAAVYAEDEPFDAALDEPPADLQDDEDEQASDNPPPTDHGQQLSLF
jgi:hypothetical protein